MAKRARKPAGFYKALNDTEDAPFRSKYRCESKPEVMGVYEVDRVVAKRKAGKHFQYNVAWRGWSSADNTWEPREHLPEGLVEAFDNSTPDDRSIEAARERLGVLFERGLRAKIKYDETIMIRHDIIRALFPEMPSDLRAAPYLANLDALKAAGLEPFLARYITVTGGQCIIATPVAMKLVLGKSPVFLDADGNRARSRLLEKLKVTIRKNYHGGRSV